MNRSRLFRYALVSPPYASYHFAREASFSLRTMTSKEYLTFILDQLSDIEGITFRPMMEEYLLYRDGRLFGGLYDNRFLVKPTASLRSFLQEQSLSLLEESPYSGAKKMLLIRDCENKEFLENLIAAILGN